MEKNQTKARITAVHKERYELVCEYGQTSGKLKSSIYYVGNKELYPTVGDYVLIEYNPSGESMITKTLERKSFFLRLDPSSSGHGEQVVASNFDYVFILSSLNNDLNTRRIERYLTLAWQSGGIPVVILTKADLADDYTEQIRNVREVAIGVNVHAISAKTGYGLDTLSDYVKKDKTIVFLGSSGVGKSSLVNALAGENIMDINEIREDDSRGRHTTTHRQLINLPNGAVVIDTPGMRELGMWDVTEGISQSFSDIEQYFGLCKFKDCTHNQEPGCAVKAAIENGSLTKERYLSYQKLKQEAKYSDDKEGYLREKQQWHKAIAKQQKNYKNRNTF